MTRRPGESSYAFVRRTVHATVYGTGERAAIDRDQEKILRCLARHAPVVMTMDAIHDETKLAARTTVAHFAARARRLSRTRR